MLSGGEGAKLQQTTITCLPQELLVRVLASLAVRDWANVAETCRAFRSAAATALGGLTFIDLKNGGPDLNAHYFARLCSHLSHRLRRLELDMWHLDELSLEGLPPGIQTLALTGCDHHSDAVLHTVACQLAPSLTSLAWSGFGGSVSAAGFADLAASCRHLNSFAIDAGASLDPNQVVQMLAACRPALEELSAYDLHRETFLLLGVAGVRLRRLRHKRRRVTGVATSDATLELLVRICPLLQELVLVDKTDGSIIRGAEEGLSDQGLLSLTQRAPTLTVLGLKLHFGPSYDRCSEVAVMELASSCSRLARLELCNFRRLSDPPFYELVQGCCHVVELAVDGAPISDASLELLPSLCPRLRSLSIKSCRKLTEQGMMALGRCSMLVNLNAGQAAGLTDTSIAAICQGATGLKNLVLNYGQISDAGLLAIARCPKMEELALHSCPRITNKGVRALASGCPLLRHLSLSYCEHVSDAGIMALAASCPRLQKIRLDSCRLLSNPCVEALCHPGGRLCNTNGRLRHLSMQHCPKLSDGVFARLAGTPSLRHVDLPGRGKLSEAALQAFRQEHPLVEIFLDGLAYIPSPLPPDSPC